MSQSTIFSVMPGWVFLGRTSTKQGLMCLAQGHEAVTPVRLEPATPQFRVNDSNSEPLRTNVSDVASKSTVLAELA